MEESDLRERQLEELHEKEEAGGHRKEGINRGGVDKMSAARMGRKGTFPDCEEVAKPKLRL